MHNLACFLFVSIVLKVSATIFLALFPVVNPVGTALILSGMAGGVDPTVWKSMSRNIALYRFSCSCSSTCSVR